MAKTTKAQKSGRREEPVSERILKAAKRIGREPAQEAEAPVDPLENLRKVMHAHGEESVQELERLDEELDVLRNLANAAELIFENQGEVDEKPENVLTEALRTAGEDFALLEGAAQVGEMLAPARAFRRAELRCQLALALFEYRRAFGYPEPAGDVAEQEGGAS